MIAKIITPLRVLYITSLLLINLPLSAIAAQEAEKMWSALTLSGNYGKVVYNIEPQLRLIYRNNPFQQFLTNAGIGYKVIPNWQIWIGQTFSAHSQDAVNGSLDEYRLWQQIVWEHRFPSLTFVSRTRFEERKAFSFPDWSYRLRERVLLNHPITKDISIVLSNEVFYNINNAAWISTDRFDQNRAYLGIEQHVTESSYLGIGYLNQYLSTRIPQSNHVLFVNWRINLENNS